MLIGLAAGLVAIGLARPWSGGAPMVPSPTSGPGSGVVPKSATNSNNLAVNLSDQWAQASDLSTCSQWAGADGMGSVRLNSTQIAWFFSDTYMGPANPTNGYRNASGLMHNSVVVQTTRSQSNRFVTLTGGGTCRGFAQQPNAVVQGGMNAPGRNSSRYWAEGGIKIGPTVYQFYQRYTSGNVPYVAQGTVIAEYPVSALESAGTSPQANGTISPSLVNLKYYTMPGQTNIPAAARSSLVWGAAVTQVGDMVYIYGTWTPTTTTTFPSRNVYLARVPASQLGDFSAWRFYAGPGKWSSQQGDAAPLTKSITLGISSGFSVIQSGGRYWLIEADPISGSDDLDAIAASSPWGPFNVSNKVVLYHDPGIGLDAHHGYMMMYEARADPAVSPDGSIVIGYNVNSIAVSSGCTPLSWFTDTVTLPRFVSVPLANLSLSRHRPTSGVLAAAPNYSNVISKDPGQWFSQWNYPTTSCPPIPALDSVVAKPEAGGVQLSFPGVGLGFGYFINVRKAGTANFTQKAWVKYDLTFHADQESAKLTGMSSGTYQIQVVPVNVNNQRGTGDIVTVTIP